MTKDAVCFLLMALCGATCGFIYDFFRSIHYELKKHNVVVIITDIIYWVIVTAIILYNIQKFYNGAIRGYIFLGLLLGTVLYFSTVSRWIYKCFLIIIINLIKFIQYIFKIVLTVLRFLYKILVMPIMVCFLRIKEKDNEKDGGRDDRIKE